MCIIKMLRKRIFVKLVRRHYLFALFMFLLLIAGIIPGGSWTTVSNSGYIGPEAFDSTVSRTSKILVNPTDADSNPDRVDITFNYKVYSRPKTNAFLVSTSSKNYAGIKFIIDNWGNIFLTFESRPELNYENQYQLIKVSDPQNVGEMFKVKLSVNLNDEIIDLSLNNQPVPISSARPNEAVSIPNILMENSQIEIGGSSSLVFSGQIEDFKMSWGQSRESVDLVNLKLIVLLCALIVLGHYINLRRGIHSPI